MKNYFRFTSAHFKTITCNLTIKNIITIWTYNKIYFRMFSIDEDGVIRTADLSALNSSTVHLVAIATDTGIPPRQVKH